MPDANYNYDESKMLAGITSYRTEMRTKQQTQLRRAERIERLRDTLDKMRQQYDVLSSELSSLLRAAKEIRVEILRIEDGQRGIKTTIQIVCEVFGIERHILAEGRGNKEQKLPRYAAMHILHQRGMSFAAIGRILGRHHTSVMRSVDRAKELMASDQVFRHAVDEAYLRLAAESKKKVDSSPAATAERRVA